MVPDDRGRPSDDDEDEPRGPAWSAPRTTPGAMGAALDDVFGVPSLGADTDADASTTDDDAEDAEAEGDAEEGDAETDVEGDASRGRGDDDRRSVGAETDVEGRSSGPTDPDGDGSSASRDSTAREGAT